MTNSWKALGGGAGGQDPQVVPGDKERLGGCERGQDTNMARGGISTGCAWGLTLPFGLLHAGVSSRDGCHPSVPLGWWLRSYVHIYVLFSHLFCSLCQ